MTTMEKVIAYLKSLEIEEYSSTGDVMMAIVRKEREAGEKLFSDVETAEGASKICLLFKDESFIVKWSKCCDYDENPVDEAMDEVIIYQKAVEAGLDVFFPKTALLATINGVNFVVQERIDFCCRTVPCATNDHYRKITQTASDKLAETVATAMNKHANGYARSINTLWIKMILVIYGKRVCKKLCEFIVENRINDLHGSNVGYKHNRPMLLDFSGYHRD